MIVDQAQLQLAQPEEAEKEEDQLSLSQLRAT